jgi:hypothetical protein
MILYYGSRSSRIKWPLFLFSFLILWRLILKERKRDKKDSFFCRCNILFCCIMTHCITHFRCLTNFYFLFLISYFSFFYFCILFAIFVFFSYIFHFCFSLVLFIFTTSFLLCLITYLGVNWYFGCPHEHL